MITGHGSGRKKERKLKRTDEETCRENSSLKHETARKKKKTQNGMHAKVEE
jgi:hypothetical protein